jgi:hypothetical protein
MALLLNIIKRTTALFAVLYSLLFLFIAYYGRLKLQAPMGVFSSGSIDRAFWSSVSLLVLWIVLDKIARKYRDTVSANRAKNPFRAEPIARYEDYIITTGIVITGVLMWLRCFYRTYYRLLMRLDSSLYHPFWPTNLLFASVIIGSVFLWRSLRRQYGAMPAFFGAVFYILSPFSVSVRPGTALAYAGAAIFIALSDFSSEASFTSRQKRLFSCAVFPWVIAGCIIMHFAGFGWSFSRLSGHVLPRFSDILLIIGFLAYIFERKSHGNIAGILVMALSGLVLGPTQGDLGLAGCVFVIPAVSIFISSGISFLWDRTPVKRTVFASNILLILVGGIFLKMLMIGISHSPFYPG